MKKSVYNGELISAEDVFNGKYPIKGPFKCPECGQRTEYRYWANQKYPIFAHSPANEQCSLATGGSIDFDLFDSNKAIKHHFDTKEIPVEPKIDFVLSVAEVTYERALNGDIDAIELFEKHYMSKFYYERIVERNKETLHHMRVINHIRFRHDRLQDEKIPKSENRYLKSRLSSRNFYMIRELVNADELVERDEFNNDPYIRWNDLDYAFKGPGTKAITLGELDVMYDNLITDLCKDGDITKCPRYPRSIKWEYKGGFISLSEDNDGYSVVFEYKDTRMNDDILFDIFQHDNGNGIRNCRPLYDKDYSIFYWTFIEYPSFRKSLIKNYDELIEKRQHAELDKVLLDIHKKIQYPKAEYEYNIGLKRTKPEDRLDHLVTSARFGCLDALEFIEIMKNNGYKPAIEVYDRILAHINENEIPCYHIPSN